MDIIDKLIKIKSRKNWTNYKIAKESNLPNSTISNIFNHKTFPQIDTLTAICNGFGITLAEFFSDDIKYEGFDESKIEILKLWDNLSDDKRDLVRNLMIALDNSTNN